MFRVGDQVKLSEMGRKKYKDTPYNPHNGIGIVKDNISSLIRGSVRYDVRWLSGEWNVYCKKDLELAYPPISLAQMLKECLE